MKLLFTVLAMLILNLVSFAQNTPTLKANQTVSKAEAISAKQLKFTLNEHKCRLDHLSIQKDNRGTYGLKVTFARPCDNANDVTVNFAELSEALLVKDLVMNVNEYDYFNLFTEQDGTTSFEIIYSK